MTHGNPKVRIGKNVYFDPEVSVITPAFNAHEHIVDTIKAVADQTFDGVEHIVVNDGSPDTEELKKALAPFIEDIIYIERENGGPGLARNTGISVANGKFLAFVDADDIWHPEFLELQVKELEKQNLDLIYSNSNYFGAVHDPERTYFDRAPSVGRVTTESLIEGTCNVIISGTLVKKSHVDAVDGFRQDVPVMGMEDFDLWIRLSLNGTRFGYQDRVLLDYRVHESNMSGGELDVLRRDKEGVEFLVKEYDLNKSQMDAVRSRLEAVENRIAIEQGKVFLVRKEYKNARDNFAKIKDADSKTSFLKRLVSISPGVARFVFKKLRKEEFAKLDT